MTPNEVSSNLAVAVEAAAEDVGARVPEMRDIVEAFAALARERGNIGIDPAVWPGVKIFDPAAFGAGEPLLAGHELPGLRRCFADAAQKLLPAIAKVFPRIGSQTLGLRSALAARPELSAQILDAALAEDPQALQAAAKAAGIPAATLSFLAVEVLKPCLRQAAGQIGRLADDDLWCKSYCPVCGALPDFGLLKEKRDPSEFLISKAGRLWLHCSLCGWVWRFVRLICPSCGQKDHEQLDVLTAEGREHERIHGCRVCRRYLLVIDLVESREKFHPDLSPLGLVPLDLLAQEKGYAPLAQTPWNSFIEEET